MKTWLLRSCKKCGGDLYLGFDFEPIYECINCGLTITVKKYKDNLRVADLADKSGEKQARLVGRACKD